MSRSEDKETSQSHIRWRARVANALASLASFYVSLLIAMLILKGTVQQPKVPSVALIGVAAAAVALILAGVLGGAVRSTLPAVAAYAIVGLSAQHFTRSLSRAMVEGWWLLAALLICVAVFLGCVSVKFGRAAGELKW